MTKDVPDRPNFDPDSDYVRQEIHQKFGGNPQKGISAPADWDVVFVFTGPSGKEYGYDDAFLADGTLEYFGEGRTGDMEFTENNGNTKIRDHKSRGLSLHVFEQADQSGVVSYHGEYEYENHDWVDAPDENDNDRKAIRFRLSPREKSVSNLFLAPCSNEHAQAHLADTVLDGVDVDQYRDLVPAQFSGKIPIWGTGEGNENTVRQMEQGDIILFYVGDNVYSHMARIRKTEWNPDLDAALWTPYQNNLRKENSDSWPWIMYLDAVTPVNIDSSQLHSKLGYSRNYVLGLQRVDEDRLSGYDSIGDLIGSLTSTSRVTSTSGGETVDMYIGTRGEGSASEIQLEGLSLEELRQRAEEAAQAQVSTKTTQTTRYSRSAAIKRYAKERADGQCEGCGSKAPFKTKQGDPYLEVHHLHELSDEGADDPDAVAAICPNCHRQIHYGEGGSEFNKKIANKLGYDLT